MAERLARVTHAMSLILLLVPDADASQAASTSVGHQSSPLKQAQQNDMWSGQLSQGRWRRSFVEQTNCTNSSSTHMPFEAAASVATLVSHMTVVRLCTTQLSTQSKSAQTLTQTHRPQGVMESGHIPPVEAERNRAQITEKRCVCNCLDCWRAS